jgi:hypothetical protein
MYWVSMCRMGNTSNRSPRKLGARIQEPSLLCLGALSAGNLRSAVFEKGMYPVSNMLRIRVPCTRFREQRHELGRSEANSLPLRHLFRTRELLDRLRSHQLVVDRHRYSANAVYQSQLNWDSTLSAQRLQCTLHEPIDGDQHMVYEAGMMLLGTCSVDTPVTDVSRQCLQVFWEVCMCATL